MIGCVVKYIFRSFSAWFQGWVVVESRKWAVLIAKLASSRITTYIKACSWSESGLKETGRHGENRDDHRGIRKAVFVYVHSCTPPKAERGSAH
jgi:hypothetical protein